MGGHGFREGTACACFADNSSRPMPASLLASPPELPPAAPGKVVPNRFGIDVPCRAFQRGVVSPN
ncbi:MAG: hypothetical protein KIG19_02670, partial [Bacteroidales bacterium]|nr:hypothetical protein [Bacteroidales bacterium]